MQEKPCNKASTCNLISLVHLCIYTVNGKHYMNSFWCSPISVGLRSSVSNVWPSQHHTALQNSQCQHCCPRNLECVFAVLSYSWRQGILGHGWFVMIKISSLLCCLLLPCLHPIIYYISRSGAQCLLSLRRNQSSKC